MKKTEIRVVSTRKELKGFVSFPFELYRGNPFWCPPLKSCEIKTLSKGRNPAFDYCEAQYWMAWQDGRPVGRIAGILNHHEPENGDGGLVRFGWIDFIDDPDVSHGLIDAVKEWGRSKGKTAIHGPLGFTNMDAEGMLIEGFEETASMSTIYNYPYYPDHMERLGFRKAADWLQYEVNIPAESPGKVDRMNRAVFSKYDLHVLKPRTTKEIRTYAARMFGTYNHAFREIYGFTPLTPTQVDYYTESYLGFLRPEFVSLVVDAQDEVVGFGITIPGLSRALQKAGGSLFPAGFLYLRKALRKNDTITLCLVGVRPDYQGKGLLALIYHGLNKACREAGIKTGRTLPQLEDNLKAVSIWKNYDSRVFTRRRCWIGEI
jgi:GNAT superfamily N-acetyltransferase